jgi:hypothetical protein
MLASVPSMELESEIAPTGNPDSSQKQHALGGLPLQVGIIEPDIERSRTVRNPAR